MRIFQVYVRRTINVYPYANNKPKKCVYFRFMLGILYTYIHTQKQTLKVRIFQVFCWCENKRI